MAIDSPSFINIQPRESMWVKGADGQRMLPRGATISKVK